ncbi:hypothetical protein C8A00DRAFT_33716 [Chaetomidium leptoderma]|uniref:Uncharacterized protein n=1 Tax=Chaetomidium leptoderma TaxID=669021 RepID=A0AAN6VNI2_9PEZI|nr:hypothetical protein C8A00DRAFT_33716 [Chaetomidium leptoderma]
MLSNIFIFALVLAPAVSAHGKVTVVTGNAGGNGTALAIRGGIVPGAGPNSKTEVDTTVFGKTNLLTNGLGKTTGSGKNHISMLVQAMSLSGTTLPQITSAGGGGGGGNISGVFHIVTADGAGPIQAVLDPTATGDFARGIPLPVLQQIPGEKGNFVTSTTKKQGRSLWERAVDHLLLREKRGAANVNQSFGFAFAVPAGTTCSGTVAGLTGVCLVKIANSNKAGPFGGVVPVQIAAAAAAKGTAGQAGQAAACGRAFRA